MRGVMRDWLKALFVWQSVLSVVACGAVAYDAVPFAGHLELYVQVLGFWGIWLFTILHFYKNTYFCDSRCSLLSDRHGEGAAAHSLELSSQTLGLFQDFHGYGFGGCHCHLGATGMPRSWDLTSGSSS